MRYNLAAAYLLWLLSGFGALGFHRFYLGKTGTGVLWLLTGGLGMVGSIYDFFTLSRQVEKANFEYAYRAGIAMGAAPTVAIQAEAQETLERTILRVAKKNKGTVTPGEVALEGGHSLEDAKRALEKLAAEGSAEMRVRSSGVVAYVFAEFAEGGSDYVL